MGQDISSTEAVCFLSYSSTSLSFTVDTTKSGANKLPTLLQEHGIKASQVQCVMEHCGFYSNRWAQYLLEKGFLVSLVETKAIQRVKGDHKRKDDDIDARALWEYGNRFYDRLTPFVPLSDSQRQLSELYSLYKLEKKATTAKKQLLRVTTFDYVKEHIRADIKAGEVKTKNLVKQAKQVIRKEPELQTKFKVLMSIPGVGEITTWKFLSHFPTDRILDGRQLASWLGVAPGPNRSGKFIGRTKSSGYGNKEFRRLLHLGARSSVTHYKGRKAYYERKLAQGKNKQVVINNVVNKMLHIIAKLWNSNEKFDPNYAENFKQAA